MIAVELHVGDDVPESKAKRAVTMIASLDRYVDPTTLQAARLTLRREASPTPFVADASVVFDGRVFAAHEAARSAELAADAVAQRLRRQLRSVVDATVALRNEPRAIDKALRGIVPEDHSPAKRKPPEERVIVRRRPYSEIAISTLDAVADLAYMEILFNLFRHVLTCEDVVVFVRDDARIGLIHPQGSPLADENDVVIPIPSRYSEPLALDEARAEMDFLNHRFLYFTDSDDGRGKVLYLRRDGDYGLVEPAGGTSTTS